ncbi:MAG: PDZ domain-containing protein [Blastochloris sp.]|nr:PDZ domain-containing protein [Blastochloris sp.]
MTHSFHLLSKYLLLKFPTHLAFTLCLSLLLLVGCSPSEKSTVTNESIIRVNATCQVYDPIRPWLKRPPISRQAIGTILSNNRILVTAEMVTNATYIELEKPVSAAKSSAQVEFIDYESNLALLKADDADFLNKSKPLEIDLGTKSGDDVEVWQLEDNDSLARTVGKVNTVEVGPYPEGFGRFLVYRLNLSLQYRDNAATLPVVRNNKLVGLLFRYDGRNQNGAVIAAPVIAHFLKDAADGAYEGFPRIGLGFSSLRDPQLRSYAKKPEDVTGIYVNKVVKGGPGDLGGLQEGDVLARVGGQDLDPDGNYIDPLYGKTSLEHLVSGKNYVGDTLTLSVYRDGKLLEKKVKLSRKNADDFLSPPYTYDKAPNYVVYGGLVFLELSRTLLKTFGNDWVSTAPQKLVYIDAFQDELYPDEKRRIIIIGQVLPTDGTLSYGNLSGSVITKINGVEIKELSDINKGIIARAGGMDELQLDDDPSVIYLDPLVVSMETDKLQKDFGIPALERLK